MIYKVFIDDSGKREYITPYSKDFINNPPDYKNYLDFWRNNYFVLCGIRIKQNNISEVNESINKLKINYFKTTKVEIKSDWLRNPYKRKKHYLDVYKIPPEKLNEFGDKFVDLVSKYKKEIKIIGVIFDKRYFGNNKRSTNEGNPLLKTTQVLFERLEYWTEKNAYNIVVFDQMESSLKLSIGQHKKILGVYEKNKGMAKIFVNEYSRIIDIKFEKSANENFLQIADICAYNIFRQFIEYGRVWFQEELKNNLPMYKYFSKIRCNFMLHPYKKTVRGSGLICLPDESKINWNLLEGCF